MRNGLKVIAAIILAALLIGAALIGLFVLLHDVAPSWADPRITDPVDRAADIGRVRTAILAVVAGVIAVVSATVGALSLRHASRVHRATQSNEQARRANELYAAAATQLGSPNPAVRLAGIYSFDRLAEQEPQLRQTIVDVWCGYLRIAPEPEPVDPAGGQPSPVRRGRDREVRQTIQRLLAQHLSVTDHHWSEPLNLDLRGAELVDLTLVDVAMTGELDLRGARFYGATLLDDSHFQRINARDAQFLGNTSLSGTSFGDLADFSDARFDGPFEAVRARFRQGALFVGSSFGDGANFTDAHITGSADFEHATFTSAGFDNAVFAPAERRSTLVDSAADARFEGLVFEHASFDWLSLSGAKISSTANYWEASVHIQVGGPDGKAYRAERDPLFLHDLLGGSVTDPPGRPPAGRRPR
ncbi:pentapeptide repeat-containing protein [Conexibacter stalactiti]|uniref:Pentapeptide repeat-containing protein n=1 Tax=Conexibacter stalactiti TaxID=1940611 RepID=A0ABU4HMG4_9ACTN|nr:pentapeptide repeat-containing protein [Conexibacter stalactiti]MDW5593917.1 pentapeptide repeat-containing protein [Conexibacter stalactiti]MEC5034559.1 pentapeptide repeat-containing protein [Conexibacter stalactiti]